MNRIQKIYSTLLALSFSVFGLILCKADVPAANEVTRGGTKSTIAILVPSFGSWHNEKHDENHEYFKAMHKSFQDCGVALEVFKGWHNPAVLKDFIHFRLEKACNSDVMKNETDLIDRTRKAKVLLHVAIPDQVKSGLESGWRADHRILASQALAFTIIDYLNSGQEVTVVGLGVGGGQIAAGASRLLSDAYQASLPTRSPDQTIEEIEDGLTDSESQIEVSQEPAAIDQQTEKTTEGENLDDPESRSIAGIANELASVMDMAAPFFGPYATFFTWGARASRFAARAAEILKNDRFLWQAAKMPVDMYKRAFLKDRKKLQTINKLYTIGVPVGLEHFAPAADAVDCFYNLYSKGDFTCRFIGRKGESAESRTSGVANLSIKFDKGIISPSHIKMLNNPFFAASIPLIHEKLQNPQDFKFGVAGQLLIYKDKVPLYSVE